ncbi:amidohydrolase [Flavihumibacter sp. UBA7668]|uniref:amidohydrolase n=1 Tax=Flavihumibacter sp. UBA7668 TaxID=1946542 RepID=UPI0025BEA81F|nr:amidohydrolase [Flavihumibacter sp. UBA7668]
MKYVLLASMLLMELTGYAQINQDLDRFISVQKEELIGFYKQLHQNPELSFEEAATSALLAKELKKLGVKVTENIGGFGVVGVLENGKGPTILVRTDMDALPIQEATGASYASTKIITDKQGNKIPVMHACGHDFHMTTWLAVARFMDTHRKYWKGTLVFIAQPAEEKAAGAKGMLADGLYSRFPKPDYALALHVNSKLPAGTVGYCPGGALAKIDLLDITVKGKGGHGGMPNFSKDPIVLAAQLIMSLQTIVSREVNPAEPAVLTIGSIHGGSNSNTIPAEVQLGLTIRSLNDSVQAAMIRSVQRIANGVAMAAGLEEKDYPVIHLRDESSPLVYNDPTLSHRIGAVFQEKFGKDKVILLQPEMYGEDFGMYRQTDPPLPTLIYSVGTVGTGPFVSTHSPLYLPEINPGLETGIKSLTWALLDLLKPAKK